MPVSSKEFLDIQANIGCGFTLKCISDMIKTCSQLKTLFASKHEEADAEIVYCCSSFNKPSVVKAKDTDILILMIYTYVVHQPQQDWYKQIDKDSFVSIRKIYEKFGITISLLLPQFYATTGCDTASYFFNVSKRVVYERASSGITHFNMIVELGSF